MTPVFIMCKILACTAVTDQSHVVRNASLFAIGQFSEYLQVTL